MKTRVFAAVLLLAVCGAAAALEVPLLDELRKPAGVAEAPPDDVPSVPGPVPAGARIADAAAVAPGGAVWFLTVPDAKRCLEGWNASPIGRFLAEGAMERTLRNNRFGLSELFGDLPPSTVRPGRVRAMEGMAGLVKALAGSAEAMAMAGYIDGEGAFGFAFLFDVGLDRSAASAAMSEWETVFLVENAGAQAKRSNRADDHIDVWTLPPEGGGSPAAVAAGFVRNIAVVSNDPVLAERSLALAEGGGDSVAASRPGRRLAVSGAQSGASHLTGFVRMGALLDGLGKIPLARDAVAELANVLGHEGRSGEALYYGLQFGEDGVRETYLLPPEDPAAPPSSLDPVVRVLRPSRAWSTPRLLPYQPSPVLLAAADLDPNAFGAAPGDVEPLFLLPPEARALLSGDLRGVLTGECTLALYPPAPAGIGEPPLPDSWILVLRCREDPSSRLAGAARRTDYNGAVIHSSGRDDWRARLSWAGVSSGAFRRAEGHFLLLASRGGLLANALDQLVSGQSFIENRDFAAALSKAERNQGLFFYYNTEETIAREYPNLSAVMRRLSPRSPGLNSRPPLSLLRRYGKGVTGSIPPPAHRADNDGFTRLSVRSPFPTIGALALGIVLRFPVSLREEGRSEMEKSRENLRSLWLRLQLYASRFGHFPETLADLAADMRTGGMDRDAVSALLTAPAALALLSPAEAREGSYAYAEGVTPGDEPDIPVLWEARPWSLEFSGVYPEDGSKGASETGDFEPFRQYVRLDGTVGIVSERRFQSTVLRRMRERE